MFRSPPPATRRSHSPLAALTATSLALGTLVLTSPVAGAAPCGDWPPANAGGVSSLGSLPGSSSLAGPGSLSDSLGLPSRPPAPWHNGESGYIPILEGRTTTVELLTGPTSPNNTVERFGITGTDLGILWDNGGTGEDHQVLMALGDTMGDCSVPGTEWRSNILFRSSDDDLSDGMRIDSAPMERKGMARSILPRQEVGGEVTVIPTAGIEVDGTQYLRYMSVASWDEPGEWTTNYSALASSEDNGENWDPVRGTARTGDGNAGLIPEDVGEPFTTHSDGQMSAFLRDEGYVYEYLTPSGRSGTARLARVPEDRIEDMAAYEFWDGSGWDADHTAAEQVIPAPGGSSDNVSELSVSWNEHLQRYIALYTDRNTNIVMRQAEHPEGPWSGKDILLSYQHVPTLYGAYIHPWSPAVTTDDEDLYFTMSTWDAYNVFLMKTDLSELQSRTLQAPRARMQLADDSWFHDTPDPADTEETVLVERRPIPEN